MINGTDTTIGVPLPATVNVFQRLFPLMMLYEEIRKIFEV